MAPTLLTLPLEIRRHIYALSGCLTVNQVCEISGAFQYTDPSDENQLISVILPKCSEGCFPRLKTIAPKSFSIWINRRTEIARKEAFSLEYPQKKHIRKLYPNCKKRSRLETGLHGLLHTDRVVQPELTKVNKQVRVETLQLFYGSGQSFLFTLFDKDTDSISIFKWLRTIGKHNASLLRSVKIVYRKKKDRKFIEMTLLPAINKLGVRTEAKQPVVVVTRLTYPFCYCEECIRKLLGEG